MTKMIVVGKMRESIRKQDFISTREAAKRLGVALSTVQAWVESGVLPAWKTAGGHRRIPAEAVSAFNGRQQESLASGLPPQTRKILVVEDDPVMRHLYRQQIAGWQLPIELLTAEDGFAGEVEGFVFLVGEDGDAGVLGTESEPQAFDVVQVAVGHWAAIYHLGIHVGGG
jgi:excisionase family DNA binding protein